MNARRKTSGSKARGRKKVKPQVRATRGNQESLYFATFLGLLVILLLVLALVIGRAPDMGSNPSVVAEWLKRHKSPFYFDEAKVLVRPLIQTSIENWSRQYFDPSSDCVEVGNGVWYAFGTVDTRSRNDLPAHQSWFIYFKPETKTLLYAKVGDVEAGNLQHALSLIEPQMLPGANAP